MNAPDHLHGLIGETVVTERDTAQRRNLWAVVLGLAPVQDGNAYGIVWGDLPTGVAGFGKTPYEAMCAFETAMHEAARVPPLSGDC
jgi:hypothetical protein